MTTPEDLRANAEYIRMADEFVEVPGGSNNNNYANVRLIVEQALACRADAVWAGWGHASEYPALPDTLRKHGITFIGPTGSSMRALGDKIGSTIIAQSAGVPTIAWNGADLTVNYKKDGLSDAAIDAANIKTVAQATEAAQRVGFPLMIKASEGGGGKGIRKVTCQAELPAAFEAVKGEVPGSPIFLMRLVNAARHLEVQLLADEYGTAIALSGRDCSVQRRHQKILEEGPVLAAPPSVWRSMEQAAVRLAEEVGYANAGTVEYLFADSHAAEGEGRASARAVETTEADRYSFAFLELNPRLQVEHPVTEMITGVNLPAAQLHVAMGVPLHRIPDVRRLYRQEPFGDSVIDFKTTEPLPPKGHVIATRITAENPDSGFQPTSGAVRELNFRSVPDVWGYFSVDSTGRVHEFADSQIGHLFAWGSDREEARRKMVMVLKEVSIRGDIHTTVEYLADLLQTSDYKRNAISTQWLDKRISANVVPVKPNSLLVAVLGAVWSAKGALGDRKQEYLDCVERGQLPSGDLLSLNTPVELIYDDTKYIFRVSATGPSTLDVECNGSSVDVHVRQLSDGGMLVVVGGKSHVVYGSEESAGLRLMIDGATCMFTQEYDPTVLRAAQTGKLAKCSVPDGTHLTKGDTFAQVEVMKMFLPLIVPESGVVTFAKAEGTILSPGDLIARLQLDDSSTVHKSSDFTGQLPQSWLELKGQGALPGELRGEVAPAPAKAQTLVKGALATLQAALDGFEVSRTHLARAWSQWDAAFADSALALQEFEDALAVVASRLPYKVQDQLAALVEKHRQHTAARAAEHFQAQGGDASEDAGGVTVVDLALPSHMQGGAPIRGGVAFDTSSALQLLQAAVEGMSASERSAFDTLVAPLASVCAAYAQGVANANRQGLLRMLQRYMDVERQWHNLGNSVERSGSNAAEEVMRRLRQAWLDAGGEHEDVHSIYDTFCAHAHLRQRNSVLLQVLERVAEHMERAKVEGGAAADAGGEEALLHSLAELQGAQYAEVALEARQLLIRAQQPSVLQRLLSVETVLKQAHTSRQQSHNSALAPKSPTEHGESAEDSASDPLISLVNQEMPMADVLMMYFASRSAQLRQQAIEVYVRRLYRAYAMTALYVHDVPAAAAAGQGATFSMAAWNFQSSAVEAEAAAGDAPAVPAALLERLAGAAPEEARRTVPPTAIQAVPTVSAPSVSGAAVPARRGFAPLHMLPSDSYDDLAAAMSVDARKARLSSALSNTAGSEDDTPVDSPTHEVLPARGTVHVDGVAPDAARVGILSVHNTLGAFEANAEQLLTALAKADEGSADSTVNRHVLHVVLLQSPAVHGRLDSASSHGEGRPRGETASTLTGDGLDGLDDDEQDTRVVACLTASVASVKPLLKAAGIRRVTFLVPHVRQGSLLGAADGLSAALASGKSRSDVLSSMKTPMHPHIYTLRAATDFAEDPIVRHIEPPLSGYLELRRLSNFRIRLVPTPNVAVHVYEAVPANLEHMKQLPRGTPRKRFFVRAIVRQTSRLSTVKDKLSQFPGPERVFVDCLNALEVAVGDSMRDKAAPVGNTHIFMNMLPVALVQQEYISQVIKVLAKRYAARLRRLRVSHVEFKIVAAYPPGSSPVPLRLISSSPTGYVLRVNTYVEAASPSGGTPVFMSVEQHSSSYASAPAVTSPAAAPAAAGRMLLPPVPGSSLDAAIRRAGLSDPPTASAVAVGGELDGRPVTEPYPIASEFEGKRALAAAMSDTLYVYDFMELFEKALESDWNRALASSGGRPPSRSVEDDDGTASTSSRPAALEGMSAGAGSTGPMSRPPRLMEVTELVLRRKGPAADAAAGSRGLPRMYSELFSNEMGQSDTPKGGDDSSWGGGEAPSGGQAGQGAAGGDTQHAGANMGVRLDAASPANAVDHMDWELVESHRAPGQNTIGMVAWVLTLFTPECPQERGGRKLVIIANDITHRAGSFGTMEDRLFSEASRYARERGLPRVYLAANSGARIGLAQEVKEAFRVAWKDPEDLTKGFHYLYLAPDDYRRLAALGSVAARRHMEGAEERYILTDIIGVAPDIGVENLRGSGGIAGETSRACASSCTLTYVTGRSVGIGAYLVRLGQRVIQKEGSAPIILTGYQALNKLIGRSVYASNLQLGGPHVMHSNGVSHNTVGNDFEGVAAILAWLSYIPAYVGAPLPISALPACESVERAVQAAPPADGPYDPRTLLAGSTGTEEEWLPGFFDKGSWSECLDGWARTVISGRARLGGIPCGVILPEVRSVTSTTPADPATPTSQETQVQQAGQVWYPDSAYKTAEAIRCFNQEGLPLFVFANWRGFSGGQRDMFQEVLKFGSYIVDALVEYKQPVFVYILPRGELRGGAWVVVDPSINPQHMEMYADPTGRGGILEPSGITSIKFRQADMLAALHRVDPALVRLDGQLAQAAPEDSGALRSKIASREANALSAFVPAANAFADLHDTPGRMMAKGVIRGVVPWARSRGYFYWRLRRRLAQASVLQQLVSSSEGMGQDGALAAVRGWYLSTMSSEGMAVGAPSVADSLWNDDLRVLRWLAVHRESIQGRALVMRRESVLDRVVALGREDPMAVVSGVLALVHALPAEQRNAVVGALRRGVVFASPAEQAPSHPYLPADVASIPPSPMVHAAAAGQQGSAMPPLMLWGQGQHRHASSMLDFGDAPSF